MEVLREKRLARAPTLKHPPCPHPLHHFPFILCRGPQQVPPVPGVFWFLPILFVSGKILFRLFVSGAQRFRSCGLPLAPSQTDPPPPPEYSRYTHAWRHQRLLTYVKSTHGLRFPQQSEDTAVP